MTLWRDPDFEAGQRAFYYVRALENPTCRWITWGAIRTGVAPRPDLQATIQERVWSSPIWLVPGGERVVSQFGAGVGDKVFGEPGVN